MSMARLLYAEGRRQAADEILAPVYGWFTQGFDTLDLRHAKLLLDELRHEVSDRQMNVAGSL